MSRARAVPLIVGFAVGVFLAGFVVPFVIDGDGGVDDVPLAGVSGDDSTSRLRGGISAAGSTPSRGGSVTEAPGPGSTSGPAASPQSGSVPAEATRSSTPVTTGGVAENGVTPTTVKVGFLLLDVGQLSRFGISAPVVDPELLRDAYQAFVDEINDTGGVHGRTIETAYRTFEITSEESQRAACLSLTEEEKVFAVIGEFPSRSPNLCVTQEHGTLLLTPAFAGLSDDVFEVSGGLLFSFYPRGSRQMTDLANELTRMGRLRGKAIGIVNQRSNDPAGAMGDVLVAALRRHGNNVVHRSDFSADNNEAASQVPLEVQQMRTTGAEVVLLLANTLVSTQFAQAADSQGYRPAYHMTDWNYLNTDTAAQSFPASMDGTLGFTYGRAYEYRANIPESAITRQCIEIFQRRTGRSTARPELSYQSVAFACAHLGQLAAGLGATGPALARRSFSDGLQSVGGNIPEMQAWWSPGSHGPGKFDFVDQLRTQQWRSSCRCWHPIDEFRQP